MSEPVTEKECRDLRHNKVIAPLNIRITSLEKEVYDLKLSAASKVEINASFFAMDQKLDKILSKQAMNGEDHAKFFAHIEQNSKDITDIKRTQKEQGNDITEIRKSFLSRWAFVSIALFLVGLFGTLMTIIFSVGRADDQEIRKKVDDMKIDHGSMEDDIIRLKERFPLSTNNYNSSWAQEK